MEYLLLKVVVAVVVVAIGIHLVTRARRKPGRAKLPPGPLGLPLIGENLAVLRATRADRGNEWLRDRINTYGPVWKASLLCTPTVFMSGVAANKFIFFNSALQVSTPLSYRRIFGDKSIVDAHGEDHRRIRGALMEFLRPDKLKLYVGRIDAKVRQHMEENWHGRTTVRVLPLMKQLTLDIISSLLFGLEPGAVRDALTYDFRSMGDGIFAVPVNLPFTTFGRSLKAGRRARRLLEGITRDRKAMLEQGEASPNTNLITRLLTLTDDQHGQQLLTIEEIVDNLMFALLAGHDTTSMFLTYMVRQLAKEPATLAAMVQEHEEVAMNKADGEPLTWEDLSKMKFTWQVARETLRIEPPLFGNFRTATEDIEFDGYCIPKGWKVFWTTNVTQMDPSIFQDPEKFDPSRFGNQSSAPPPCSFVAFGAGPRICPGMDLVKIEALVLMHHLVRNFSWKLHCNSTSVRIPLPSPLHGMPIELEHRTPL